MVRMINYIAVGECSGWLWILLSDDYSPSRCRLPSAFVGMCRRFLIGFVLVMS